MTDPKEDEDLPSLDSLGKAIDEAKQRQVSKEQADEERRPAADAMKIGIELVAGVCVGTFVGFYLDRWLDTSPLFFLLCFFMGVAAGVVNIIRMTKEH